MSDIAEKVLRAITESIKRDEMVLPTLPEVALRVRETAEDPNADVNKLTNVLQNDTALSARVIKVANSPLMRTAITCTDLKSAVSRLGMTYTANLAMGLAMEQMFQATNDSIDQMFRQVWAHSTEVAGISHVLCRHYTKLPPDQATLAGLIHRIGALPVLTFAEMHVALQKPNVLKVLVDKLAPPLGTTILKHWDFPEELVDVPREHLRFDRTVDKADLADVVMIANLQSYIGTDHPYTQMDWNNIGAFDRLGLDPNFSACEAEDLAGDMEAAMAFLE